MRWLGYVLAGFLVLELLRAAVQVGAILLLIAFLLLLGRYPKEVLSIALLSAFLGLAKVQPLLGFGLIVVLVWLGRVSN